MKIFKDFSTKLFTHANAQQKKIILPVLIHSVGEHSYVVEYLCDPALVVYAAECTSGPGCADLGTVGRSI